MPGSTQIEFDAVGMRVRFPIEYCLLLGLSLWTAVLQDINQLINICLSSKDATYFSDALAEYAPLCISDLQFSST